MLFAKWRKYAKNERDSNTLRLLRRDLNGSCYNGICPIIYGHKWTCQDCQDYFHFINCLYNHAICPCHRGMNPNELFLRIDELIEELEGE